MVVEKPNEALDALLTATRENITGHWERFGAGGSGLPHDAQDLAEVMSSVERYFQALSDAAVQAAPLESMRALFEELNAINSRFDGRLLETDKRELVVPIVFEAAALAGLKLDAFDDGDPTLEFREF